MTLQIGALGLTASAMATLGLVDWQTASATPAGDTAPSTPAACSAMVGARFGSGTIDRAERVERGQPVVDEGPIAGLLKEVKAQRGFCRVHARLQPEPGSDIQAQVWLPDGWNGKLLATGGGGFGGGLDLAPITLFRALGAGYAGAASDVGHTGGGDARWAQNAPIKVVDWAHRGNHETAVFAKAVVAAYFGRGARRAYFQGCSNGGRDALMEARRYPGDFDGIIAGAAAANWTGMTSSFIWNQQVQQTIPGASNLRAKVALVQGAVLAQCDALDGVKDGVLENPNACRFDPAKLQCRSADGPTCLNAGEVAALRRIYAGPRSAAGKRIYPGYAVGGEAIPENKASWVDPGPDGTAAFGAEFFRWMVFDDQRWMPESFRLSRDYPLAVKKMGAIVDSNDPDIRGFTSREGKLILYHGWNDGRIPADASVTYFEAVRTRIGPKAANHVRLFMVPGMAHCAGGPGATVFDMLGPLDRWVEGGPAPERIEAMKPENPVLGILGLPTKPLSSHPLCAWPNTAHYDGAGPVDAVASFTCRAP